MIRYNWIEDGTVKRAAWEGDSEAALQAAVEYLGAAYEPELDAWIYWAEEIGKLILLDEEEILEAGAAILAGAPNWYSLWCANMGAPLQPGKEEEIEETA